jgi:hypothetical protein
MLLKWETSLMKASNFRRAACLVHKHMYTGQWAFLSNVHAGILHIILYNPIFVTVSCFNAEKTFFLEPKE